MRSLAELKNCLGEISHKKRAYIFYACYALIAIILAISYSSTWAVISVITPVTGTARATKFNLKLNELSICRADADGNYSCQYTDYNVVYSGFNAKKCGPSATGTLTLLCIGTILYAAGFLSQFVQMHSKEFRRLHTIPILSSIIANFCISLVAILIWSTSKCMAKDNVDLPELDIEPYNIARAGM